MSDLHGVITIDKRGINTAAIPSVQFNTGTDVELRQSKYLNNVVEQGHRVVKRIVRPMLGFKSFSCAYVHIAGIETMHMIKKEQFDRSEARASSAASQIYSLTF